MNCRKIVILLTTLFLFCFNFSDTCFGINPPVRNKVSLQKNIDYPVRQANLLVNIQEKPDILKSKSTQNNNDTIYIFILLIVIALGIVFFRIIDLKHKQLIALNQKEIREQTINELKIDHQLLASRAVLLGEEKERGRLSRDLHDGLGGMLSGVKFAISSIREKNSLPLEIHEKIDLAMIRLNLSISELRSIAQNLMPEALTNFGLKEALNDFCTQLGSNKAVEISFLFYGESLRFDHSIENALFRIAQEAVYNALKHSKASKIIVQLIQDESWVNLTVQDNGEGFDLENILNKESSGLKNMRARAEIFDGRFHIDSKPGEGTEIIVDLIYNNLL
jgi:two-component system, NarL family, sensor kinase